MNEPKSKPKIWEIYVSLPYSIHPAGGWGFKVKRENLRRTLSKIVEKYWNEDEITIYLKPPTSKYWYWLNVSDIKRLLDGKEVTTTVTLAPNPKGEWGEGTIKLKV